MDHHLKGRKKPLEQRAKIAASKRIDQTENPEQWQAEYELALLNLKRRASIKEKFAEVVEN